MAWKLNLAERWKVLKAATNGQWEGYEISRPRARPASRLVAQDTDLDWGTREKLMAEARAMGQIFGLPKRILRQYANYCVGDCIAQFQTANEDWNDLGQENWLLWCKMSDADGTHQFRQQVKMAIMAMLRDGDIFFQLSDFGGWPYLKAIEADRVTNSWGGKLNLDDDKVVGGCVLNAEKQVTAYRVCERDRYGNFIKPTDIPRAEMIHLFDPDRFEAYRGVTHFHTALNHLRDMKEIISAEKTGVKINSKLALFWQTVIGGARTGAGMNLFDGDTDSVGDIKHQEILDGVIAYGFPNESVKAHQSERPSAAWMGFMDLLIQDIAVGLELPKSFVWTMAGLTGPATRFEGKQAERTFSAKTDVLEQLLLNRVCGWVTAKSMSVGRLPFNAEWYKFAWQRPSMPTIDVGRESVANLNEHERGVISGLEIAAERGKDIYAVMEQKAREAQYAQELATRYNVPLSSITSMGVAPAGLPQPPDDEQVAPPATLPQAQPKNRKQESKQ